MFHNRLQVPKKYKSKKEAIQDLNDSDNEDIDIEKTEEDEPDENDWSNDIKKIYEGEHNETSSSEEENTDDGMGDIDPEEMQQLERIAEQEEIATKDTKKTKTSTPPPPSPITENKE